ncbi:MAG: SsrA-binding protein SmpB [Candidatus Paceibacteria bacterium]
MAFIENKKARFDFEILETFEAGAVLAGHEAKAVRAGRGSLDGARVAVRGGEAFLMGASVAPYQPNNTPKGYDRERARKLLMNRKEIATLADAEGKKGLTIIPLRWYNRNGKVKLEVAVVRRKKKHDKRAALKERDIRRDIERTLKNEY